MNREETIQQLERRIIDLSYKHRLSHIGSCLTALPAIYDIHEEMSLHDKFVLSCGHAGLALYVVLEHLHGSNAEIMLESCGIHPDRLKSLRIACSTGSLGQGLPIALGMAMAKPDHTVHCLISDGEAAEGSVYEALCVMARNRVFNLRTYCNFNGYAAYKETKMIDVRVTLPAGVRVIDTSQHWFIQMFGQEAHYRVLTDKDYEEIIRRFTA